MRGIQAANGQAKASMFIGYFVVRLSATYDHFSQERVKLSTRNSYQIGTEVPRYIKPLSQPHQKERPIYVLKNFEFRILL